MTPSELLKNPGLIVSIILAVGYMGFTLFSMFSVRGARHIRAKHKEVTMYMISGIPVSVIPLGLEVARLQSMVKQNQRTLERIETKTDVVEQMENAVLAFDTLLNHICEQQIKENIEFFENGIHNGRVTFTGIERFTDAYMKSLRTFPEAHAMATSLPRRKYYWSTDTALNPVEREIRDFIRGPGRMTRIFFMDPGDEKDPECIAILNKQARMGVEVMTIDRELAFEVCQGMDLFVLIANPRRELMWHIRLKNNSVEMRDFTNSTNHEEYARFLACYKNLLQRAQPWHIV